MDRVCGDHGTDLAIAALQASVRDPRVTSTIVGLSSPARLDALLVSLATDLPDDLSDELDSMRPGPELWIDHT
jgi:D-threo-aldose 1-dehydrogenase